MSEDQKEPWDFSGDETIKPNIHPPLTFADAGVDRDITNVGKLCKEWVWVVNIKSFVRRSDGVKWDREQFDSKFNHLTELSSISKALFKTQILHKFDYELWMPGENEFGKEWYNRWKPSPIIPAQGDTSLWDGHLLWLFSDDEDRNMLLDWMAWVYQNPLERPGKALLLLGEVTGTGKSFICRVMEHLIGKANTQRPANASLIGDFNEWCGQCKLVIFEELNQLGKRDTVNKLLDKITEERIEVNIKFKSPYLADNYMAIIGSSNFPDALPIDEGDRRWEIIKTRVTQAEKDAVKADGHFARLMPIVTRPDNVALAAIAYQLQTRDVSKFKQGDARMTTAKADMITLGSKPLDKWLIEMRNNDPFTRELVNIDDDIVPLVPDHVMKDPTTRNVTSMIAKYLARKLDGVSIGSHRNGRGRKSRQVNMWAINGLGTEAKFRIAAGADPRQSLGKINVTATYMPV